MDPPPPRRPIAGPARLGILLVGVLLGAGTGNGEGTFSRQIESRSGRYRAEITLEAQAERYPELNSWSATVVDSNGALCYRLERELPYDTPYPALVLSDDGGRGLVLNAFDGIVEFVDPRGTVLRRWRPFSGEEPSYERILKCSVTGDRVVFLLSEPGAGAARIAGMDLRGELSWDATLESGDAGEVYLGGNGETVVAGVSRVAERVEFSTTILEWGGVVLDTLEMLFRAADIDTSSGRIALAEGGEVREGLPGQIRPLWAVAHPEEVVREVHYLGGRLLILTERVGFTSTSPRYGPARIVLLDRDRTVALDRRLEATADQPAALRVSGLVATVSLGASRLAISLPR